MIIKISYDGAYPILCSGKLVATVDGVVYHFPDRCLKSGGALPKNPDDEVILGPWEVVAWPASMPEDVRQAVYIEINKQIPWGCCGGCL